MFTLKDIISIAIQIEKNGESIYRDVCQKITNTKMISVLEWMADEEVHHANWFLNLKLKQNPIITESYMEKINRIHLLNILEDKSFSLTSENMVASKNIADLIKQLIEFEKDTILFYEMLAPFIKKSSEQDYLENIIEQENQHISRNGGNAAGAGGYVRGRMAVVQGQGSAGYRYQKECIRGPESFYRSKGSKQEYKYNGDRLHGVLFFY